MPIYEYVCRMCQQDFEALMPTSRRDDGSLACPACGAAKVARKISLMANPVVKSGGAATASGSDFSCGAPSCCGGGCAID